MSDYYGRILNLRINKERAAFADRTPRDISAYKAGYREAQYAAAEIALEADQRLAAAEAALAAVESWMASESGPLFALWENAEVGSYEYEHGGDIDWPQTLANIRDLNCPEEQLGCDGVPVEVGVYRQIYGLLMAAKEGR